MVLHLEMGAAGVIVLVTAFLVVIAIARSWPRSAGRPLRKPPDPDRPKRTHYRTLEVADDELEPLSDEGADFVDPALPLDDRRALLELRREHRRAHAMLDGPAMIDAAERALASARTSVVRAHATRVLAHGLALCGEARAAVETLETVPHRAYGSDDYEIDVDILCRSRRYPRAMDLLRQMAIGGDGASAAARMAAVTAEADRWRGAVKHLDESSTSAFDGEQYALVREAGRLKGRNEEAAQVGERMFERTPDPDLAWAIAGCWLRARDRGKALAWVERAAQAGSREPERLDSPELAALALTSEERARLSETLT